MPVFFEYINSIWMSILAFILDFLQPLLPLFIGILMLVFIGFYCIPALFLWLRLGRLKKNLIEFRKDNLIEYPTELFKPSKLFIHLWTEYQQTLHEQRRLNPQTGVEELVAIRSTTPAEIFFGPSVLVDGRLHTEFFKHMPGILTGLGIIGTFLGLIHGLQAFQINENTEVIRQSLEQLLHGVYEAFLVSMVAIFLAMFVTIVEKSLLSKLYGKVEELCFLIDSLYESGAGEEYLERLVKSSEESTSQAKIIKDSLVKDLKEILTEITQQQIQSNLLNQQKLSEPLNKIVEGFNDQREKTGRDLSGALDNVFAAFTQRLQDLFGGKTTGIYELQQKTIEELAKLTGLVESHQLAAAEAVRSIQAAITQMSEVTTSALTGMNQGAENLIIATDNFSKAGQSVAGVLHEATGIATKLSLSADAVSISTRAMETIVGDYSTVRQQLNDMIQALKGTVESARKEASLTADVLTRIDHATQKLATAQNQADRYLAQVSEVLEETHQQFASSMRSTLKEANQQFFQHLTDATALLRGSIEELDSALGNVSTRK